MTTMRMFYVLLLGILMTGASVARLKNVTISKCCRIKEYMTSNNKCLQNDSSSWDIPIYLRSKIIPFKDKLPQNWYIKDNTRPDCNRSLTIDIKGKNHLPIINGSLYLLEYSKLIDPDQYCLDYRFLIFCLDTVDDHPERITYVNIKKCCGNSAIFLDNNSSCVKFQDNTYKIDIGQGKTLGAGFPICTGNRIISGNLREAEILSNGSIWFPNKSLQISSENYCLEHVLGHNGGQPSVITCQEYWPTDIRIELTKPQNETDLRFTLYPIGLAISAIFLAATLAAGSLLPASHHVLHWRCQTNHVACLLVGDVLLCITHLSGKMEAVPCYLIAVAMHFLFLAAFFWLNTMCFNIWWTFRDLRPQNTEKSQERIRLRLYEAYAWGIPLLISLVAVIIDLTPSSAQYEFLKPQFAVNKCWFYGDMEILTFFYGPIGILLCINLILFALTARELTCGLWKRELVKSTTERAALGRVCMKLVVVMGVTWIADIVSWAVGGPQQLWYLTDLINCLQGVFIFIVVGCQPQVLTAAKRVWCVRKHRQTGTAGTTNHHSSSSQGLPSMGDTLTNTNSVTNNTKSLPLETSC